MSGRRVIDKIILISVILAAPLVSAKNTPPKAPPSLAHPDPLIRESFASVLGLRGAAKYVPELIRCLELDKNRWVRGQCGASLGRLGKAEAIKPLTEALDKEKDQRVRRMIAGALMQLGQKNGLEEMMWQLRSGTNNSKAEAMQFLVEFFGEALGQSADDWWLFLHQRGNEFLKKRPAGASMLVELRGLAAAKDQKRSGPFVHHRKNTSWANLPAAILDFPPRRAPIDEQALRDYEAAHGALPDGCLLLLATNWRLAKETPQAAEAKKDAQTTSSPPQAPGLTIEAARYLLTRSPNLLGVGIDTAALDPSVRTWLVEKDRLVIESLDDLNRLPRGGFKLLINKIGIWGTVSSL